MAETKQGHYKSLIKGHNGKSTIPPWERWSPGTVSKVGTRFIQVPRLVEPSFEVIVYLVKVLLEWKVEMDFES